MCQAKPKGLTAGTLQHEFKHKQNKNSCHPFLIMFMHIVTFSSWVVHVDIKEKAPFEKEQKIVAVSS